MVSYLEGVISCETGRLGKMVINRVERMDEIDHMYDDMQDRVFEIDKNRKNNLVRNIFRSGIPYTGCFFFNWS